MNVSRPYFSMSPQGACKKLGLGTRLQHQWLLKSDSLLIAVKEMIPVVLAAVLWGQT